VSGIVDRLVCQGVVIREIPENNRQIVRLSLSPEWQKNNALSELVNSYIYGILKTASKEEMDSIILGLKTLYELVTETRGQVPCPIIVTPSFTA